MTLYDLVSDVCVQGDIKVVVCEYDRDFGYEKETTLYMEKCCDGVSCYNMSANVADREVLYIYPGEDGYLHIEVSA